LRQPPEQPSVDLSFEEKLEKIQRYLPDGLTDKILSQRVKIEGERKQVTVMFCDAEGFSMLSERLGPEKVYSIMDEVFEILIHKVHEYGGTVNKMTGDGVMALFGAPIALEDAPQRAIRSALAIQRDISRLSDRKKEETGNRPIRMRVGIHTGPVVVGSLGNDLRVEFTAVGDTVNLASRMEGLAEPGTVYVTEDTFNLTEGLFRFEALGERRVKGKKKPIIAYRVIAPSTRRTRFDVSAERGLTPFLGRERELELLLDGLERARAGRGQAFSIMGEAGVGKSRLLYEFRKAVANEDVFFLEGRCLSYSTNVAYHPVIDLLKGTYDIHEDDSDDRIRERVKQGLKDMGVDEASALPFVLELLSVKESGIDALNLTPEVRKDKTLEALNRTVLKGSEARPLVLAVEDLHWVDRSSEEVLKSLLDAISGAQALLIFTYRPEFVHTWGSKSYHSQVNLMRLSNRETLAMAAYILGTEVIGSDLEELILEKTEGIPFFIEEFMKSLKDLEMIEWRDSGYYLARDIKDVTIPSTIQDVIMARVDALPDGAKNVLQTGSAIGREFSCELIKRVTGVPQPEITSHLSALRDSELLYERGVFPQATYIFKHSLTQEVAYDSLLEKRKQEIHERVAEAIEQLYADRLEEFYEALAHHYSRSESHDKACRYLELSGDKAARSYSMWEAYRFYKSAITVLNRLSNTEERRKCSLRLHLALVKPQTCSGYPEDAFPLLEEGERIARELGDERSVARFRSVIGLFRLTRGGMQADKEYAENAFHDAERAQDPELIGATAIQLTAFYMISGEWHRIADIAPRTIDLLESSGTRAVSYAQGMDAIVALASVSGISIAFIGNFERAEAYCEKALSRAFAQEDLNARGYAALWYGAAVGLKGDGIRAAEHLQTAITLFEESQNLGMLGMCRTILGIAQWLLGDLDAARTSLQQAVVGIETGQVTGVPATMSYWNWVMGRVLLAIGDLERAKAHADTATAQARELGARLWEGLGLFLQGSILVKEDKSQANLAEEEILQGIGILEDLRIRPYSSQGYLALGELYADTGQPDKALEALKKAEAEFRDMGMDYWLRRTEEVLAKVEG
jgi:class 3 adenylate cyclase/tetratricopeptide (TPR) repeat protein